MLLPKVSVVPLLAAAASGASPSAASPRRIAYGSLVDSRGADPPSSLLLDGLARDGLVSVTGIPHFKDTKRELMFHLHACIASIDGVPAQHFDDGTVRRSFAASTLPNGGGARPIKTLDDHVGALSGGSESESCRQFKGHVSSFRHLVDVATRRFAERLSTEMGASLPKPLLSTSAYEGRDYDDIAQVVNGGEHLEHFHSYQKLGGQGEETTIELHTDQGFFIAFTPGLIVSSDPSEEMSLSDGFYVQDSNGEKRLMNFEAEDDLVFMMGDGVNQFINNRLVGDAEGLRATPHALTISAQEDDTKARVWYGRMVLAPNDAHLPGSDLTFGETRKFLVKSGDDVPTSVGCSSPGARTVIETSRRLDGPSVTSKCAEDEFFCWFRCQKLEEFELTPTTCEERNLKLQCVNPRGQVVPDGMKHGDYFPLCTNNTHETHPVTDVPKIDPQDDAVCTASDFEEFVKAGEYEQKAVLTQHGGTDTVLVWSIVEGDDGSKKIKGRLAFDNVFGWLGLGFANELDEVHNGMNGGSVLVAIPGSDYSAATGFATDDASVGTYVIHPKDSAFRHWMTPIETDEAKSTVSDFEDQGCFTAITFEGDSINGQKFTFDGKDEMIWAGNSYDHWMGYHQRGNRARFTVDWNTGEVVIPNASKGPEEEPEEVKSAAAKGGGILGMGLAVASIAHYWLAN